MRFHTSTTSASAASSAPSLASPALMGVAMICLLGATGCSSFKVPSMSLPSLALPSASMFSGADQEFERADGVALQPSQSAETYQKIKQAKAQNSIVLQVVGDSEPIRVLPLPPGGKSVFVSELFQQTGLASRLGRRMKATLYRPSPESLAGIRMQIDVESSGKVSPSTDYSLRAGDRIEIAKDEKSGLQSLVDIALQR